MTFWVTLYKPVRYRGADRQSFSVDGETEEEARAITIRTLPGVEAAIVSIKPLPYPGEPRLAYRGGDCPSFCMHPAKCAGRSSCPRSIACVE